MIKWKHYKLNGNQEEYHLNLDIMLSFDKLSQKQYADVLHDMEEENMNYYFTGDPR